MKISNLLNKDLKIVEKRKIFFLIPAIIVVLAIIAMIVYNSVLGSPLNLGMDFQGGYTVNVKLSTKLTDKTFDKYKSDITSVIENLEDENGSSYGLKVASVQQQGSGESAALFIRYKAVASEADMEDTINPAIQEALQNNIFKIVPTVESENNIFTATFGNFSITTDTFNNMTARLNKLATQQNVTVSSIKLSEDSKTVTITVAQGNTAFSDALVSTLAINDVYSGQAVKGDIVSATVSSELLINAFLAIALAITLMLIYIAFRFEVSSGIAAIAALMHDIIIMFSAMAIFRMEINSTFIAALITILGYSINNTIIVFDRIRENVASIYNKNSSASLIANKSVKETLLRSINTTITTMITILMVAIIGVPDIRIFAFPIIIGLLSGAYSSICISPSIWSMWKDRNKKAPQSKIKTNDNTKGATLIESSAK